MIEAKVRGSDKWEKVWMESLEGIKDQMVAHGFRTNYGKGELVVINPLTKAVECIYREVK